MKTTAYRVSRILTQLVTIILLVGNICMGVHALSYYSLWDLESTALADHTVTFYSTGLVVIAMNVMLSLFASCCITSGYKTFLRVCYRFSAGAIIINVASGWYFYCLYPAVFNSGVGRAAGMFGTVAQQITSVTGIPGQDKPLLVVNGMMERLLWAYGLCTFCSVVLLGLLAMVTQYTLTLSFVKPSPVPPRIVNMARQGLSTSRMGAYRVVEVV